MLELGVALQFSSSVIEVDQRGRLVVSPTVILGELDSAKCRLADYSAHLECAHPEASQKGSVRVGGSARSHLAGGAASESKSTLRKASQQRRSRLLQWLTWWKQRSLPFFPATCFPLHLHHTHPGPHPEKTRDMAKRTVARSLSESIMA